MRTKTLEFYEWHDSVIHRTPALLKFLVAVACIIGLALAPGSILLVLMIVLGSICAIASMLSKLSLTRLLTRLITILAMTSGIALLSLLRPEGTERLIPILLRTIICVWIVLLLTSTTSFPQLLGVLTKLRIPRELVTIMALMYRYLFLMNDELNRMRNARASRTIVKSRQLDWHSLASVVAQLYARTAARSERVYSAMCARGWKS